MVVKDVGASFDPFGFAFLRFAVAALAFSPFMKVRRAAPGACAVDAPAASAPQLTFMPGLLPRPPAGRRGAARPPAG